MTQYEVGIRDHNGFKRMLHFEASHPQQAKVKANRRGRVLFIRKVHFTDVFGNIENIPIDRVEYVKDSPYESAISMDEMIWNKRNKRRDNLHKDKEIP